MFRALRVYIAALVCVGGALSSPSARAQATPAATALSPEALAALEALAANAPKAQRIVAHTRANSDNQPERRVVLLTRERRLAMQTFVAPQATSDAPPAWPATPEQFTYIDDALVRFPSKTGDGNRYVELPREEYWKRGDTPSVVRMAIHPLLPDILTTLRAQPDLAVTRDESAGLWTARTSRAELHWNDAQRLIAMTQLIGAAGATSLEFAYADDGKLTTIRERTPASPPAPEQIVTWTVDEHTTTWASDEALATDLRFDPRALKLVQWDTTTGNLIDPDGKVVGVDKVPAVAAIDAFFTKKQQEATKQMRENPHGIPMARWIWWLAGAGVLCIVVDQIRRRL